MQRLYYLGIAIIIGVSIGMLLMKDQISAQAQNNSDKPKMKYVSLPDAGTGGVECPIINNALTLGWCPDWEGQRYIIQDKDLTPYSVITITTTKDSQAEYEYCFSGGFKADLGIYNHDFDGLSGMFIQCERSDEGTTLNYVIFNP